MWNLKKDTNEFIYKAEIVTDIESKFMVTKEEGGRNKLGVRDQHVHSTKYKIDNQQGPTVQHRELYPVSCNNL